MESTADKQAAREETGRWLLAITKHLKAFAQDARLASLYTIRQAALDGELLLRLRGARRVDHSRLRALALDVGIAPQHTSPHDPVHRQRGEKGVGGG